MKVPLKKVINKEYADLSSIESAAAEIFKARNSVKNNIKII